MKKRFEVIFFAAWLFLPFLFCSCSTLKVVEKGPDYLITSDRFKSCCGDTLRYSLLRYPETSACEKYPLLYVMHGAGQTGSAMIQNWKEAAVSRKFMVLAPTREQLYVNQPEFTDVFDLLLENVIKRYPVDENRIYVVGDSSGALYVRKFLELKPERWKGAVLIASPDSFQQRWIDDLKAGAGFPPLLYVHGAKDDQFDVGLIRKDIETFRQKGIEVELMVDPDAGHEHKKEWNEKIFEWMARKAKEGEKDTRYKMQDTSKNRKHEKQVLDNN